ncbi:VWA domain-containing protein [Streptomyces sp. NPDC002917]|uniref:VWA domain-containing protein n=1 Tax=Streptomyces sp. NPDC002917 TaxID=3364671 RepID=UPI0036B4E24D
MTRKHPPRAGALLLALAMPLLGMSASPATAAPAAADKQPRIETVLDVSGSMAEDDAGGQTRLAAAKSAVGGLLDGTPDGTAMGLRVYGAQYAGADVGPGCKDTQLLAPVEPMDATTKAAAKAEIEKLKAVGMTPIGHSLKAAAADLGDTGARRIILVSDGEDTCAPPPPARSPASSRAPGSIS